MQDKLELNPTKQQKKTVLYITKGKTSQLQVNSAKPVLYIKPAKIIQNLASNLF
jgi:hypothetical protein